MAGPGRPGKAKGSPKTGGAKKGSHHKFHSGIKATLLHVWEHLQGRPDLALIAQAEKNPRWFYELMKGCFPRDLTVNLEASLDAASTKDLLKLYLANRGDKD